MQPAAKVLAMASALVLLMVGAHAWRYLAQPFDLLAFLEVCRARGYLVSPPQQFKTEFAKLEGNSIFHSIRFKPLLTNELGSMRFGDLEQRAFFVDARRVSESLFVPLSWRKFARENLAGGGGVAYACLQVFLVDGAMPVDHLLDVFVHEYLHLVSSRKFWLGLPPDAAESLDAAMRGANDAFNTGDCKTAVAFYEKALAVCPAYNDALDNLAVCYRRLGRLDDAIRLYRASLSYNSVNTVARRNLILSMLERGLFEDARGHVDTLMADANRGEELGEAYYWRGRIALMRGEDVLALSSFDTAVGFYRAVANAARFELDWLTIALANSIDRNSLGTRVKEFAEDCVRLVPPFESPDCRAAFSRADGRYSEAIIQRASAMLLAYRDGADGNR